MPSEESRSLDLLGIKPIAESINKVTSAAVDGAAAFLSRICLPAAEEFGLLLQDRVRGWRVANLVSIIEIAKKKMAQASVPDNVHVHPRLVYNILEEGSWIEDVVVQDLWGGLLSSSCTESGDDESNLIFVNLLSGLTKLQARVLKHVCEESPKQVAPNGLVMTWQVWIGYEELVGITGENDIQRLDRELDHLRSLELITGGFEFGKGKQAWITPTPLAVHMYVRCQGSRASPLEFFDLEFPKSQETEPAQSAS